MDSARFASRLLEGERLVWTGAPRQGVGFTSRDAYLIPFSLLWGGFAIFWEAMAIGGPGRASVQLGNPVGLLFPLWGIPFVLFGLYMIFGRFLYDAWVRSDMAYALTERRALILRGANVTAIDLSRVSTINLKGGHNGGRGTIVFGSDDIGYGYGRRWGAWTPSTSRVPQFLGIERAQEVFNQIEALRARATAQPQTG